jgi:hypothetical protein
MLAQAENGEKTETSIEGSNGGKPEAVKKQANPSTTNATNSRLNSTVDSIPEVGGAEAISFGNKPTISTPQAKPSENLKKKP